MPSMPKVLGVISGTENQPSSQSFSFQLVFLKRRSWRSGVGREIKEDSEEELDEEEKEKSRKAEEMGRRRRQDQTTKHGGYKGREAMFSLPRRGGSGDTVARDGLQVKA